VTPEEARLKSNHWSICLLNCHRKRLQKRLSVTTHRGEGIVIRALGKNRGGGDFRVGGRWVEGETDDFETQHEIGKLEK